MNEYKEYLDNLSFQKDWIESFINESNNKINNKNSELTELNNDYSKTESTLNAMNTETQSNYKHMSWDVVVLLYVLYNSVYWIAGAMYEPISLFPSIKSLIYYIVMTGISIGVLAKFIPNICKMPTNDSFDDSINFLKDQLEQIKSKCNELQNDIALEQNHKESLEETLNQINTLINVLNIKASNLTNTNDLTESFELEQTPNPKYNEDKPKVRILKLENKGDNKNE